MENVTFVSNSHQRPAADNLQKLKSLLTNTRQQIKSQTQQVTIKNLYVSSFTLVCFRSGKLTISNNHDTIYCDEPGMLVLKKEQVVNVTLEEVKWPHGFRYTRDTDATTWRSLCTYPKRAANQNGGTHRESAEDLLYA